MKYDNMINIDHETRVDDLADLDTHVISYTAPIWFFNGKITDFKYFNLRNGGSTDGLENYEKLDSGHMEFSIKAMDEPGRVLFDWMCRIFNMVCDEIDLNKDKDKDNAKWINKELKYFYDHCMVILGFNDLGYDDRFMIQHFMKTNTRLEPFFIHAGGSALKTFSLKYGNDKIKRIACNSFDLMQVCGPGSLEAHIKSSVEEVLPYPGKFMTLHSRIWLTGITPYGTHILEDDEVDNEEWNNFDDYDKKEVLKLWFGMHVDG